MGIRVITPPATEPVSLAEAKLHLRVDTTEEDALISACISAAREECEHRIGRAVSQQTLGLFLDTFPDGAILLPRGPVVSVSSVIYVDADGVLVTIPGANYSVDLAQVDAWLLPAYGYEWPTPREQANAVQVQYVAGFATVPPLVKAWMLLRVGDLYAHRESTTVGSGVHIMPFHDRLLDAYRVGVI